MKRIHLALVAVMCLLAGGADAAPNYSVPEGAIVQLQNELAEYLSKKGLSVTKKRRCLKVLIRKSQALIDDHPEAVNRYQLLKIMLDAQRQLLGLKRTSRLQAEFMNTCKKLSEAPVEYIEMRLVADIVLMNMEQNKLDATADQRIVALGKLLETYRDTTAEIKALIIGAKIASTLGALEFRKKMIRALEVRFAGYPTAIAFRKKILENRILDVVFAGTYERVDGVKMSFPIDRIGRPFIVLFWSRETLGFRSYLEQVKAQQDKYPELYEIYSFNVDELADAGQSVLGEIGLKCTAMRVPGGRSSNVFVTYGQKKDPNAVIFNEYGRSTLLSAFDLQSREKKKKHGAHGHAGKPGYTSFTYPKPTPTFARSIEQLSSLLIGEFLIEAGVIGSEDTDTSSSGSMQRELRAILSKFSLPPFRYRLTPDRAMSDYKEIESRCRKSIEKYPQDAELWKLQSMRIISLQGMWKVSGDSRYFEQAVREAKTVLSKKPSLSAQIVAQFCLAKDALRREEIPRPVLETFVDATGGANAGAMALSAAVILSLDANRLDLFEHYSTLLLGVGDLKVNCPVASYVRNPYHRLYRLKAKEFQVGADDMYTMKYALRSLVVNHDVVPMRKKLSGFSLRYLDGKTRTFPDGVTKDLTLLVFIEPSANVNPSLPASIYSAPGDPNGKKKGQAAGPSGFMVDVVKLTDSHVAKSLEVVFAVLSDDDAQVRSLQKRYTWPWKIAYVPKGLSNPLVRKLGILSADHIPNAFLIRRDGTIAWSGKGLEHKKIYWPHTKLMLAAIRTKVVACAVENGVQQLRNGSLKEAVSSFSGTFPFVAQDPKRYRRNWEKPLHKWHSSRLHGRALAFLKLKEFEEALKDIDTAITEHKVNFRHDPKVPCSSMVHMQRTRSKVLDNLGRTSEARTARAMANTPPTDYPTEFFRILGYNKPYELFQDKLAKITEGL